MNDTADTFSEIYREYKDRVFRLCCAYTSGLDDRHDLFQTVFLNIWKHLDSFEGRSHIGTWMYRIAVNTALLYIKRENRHRNRFQSIDFETLSLPGHSRPDVILDDREDVRALYGAINRLPELDRLIITMTLDELSYERISDITGLTPNHVGVKINRIKKTLAHFIEEAHDGKQ